VVFALLYLVLRRLFGWAAGSAGSFSIDQSKDVEILVLRHQLKVLRRQAGRPKLRRIDRVLLAAAGKALPRRAWPSFMVAPSTLLRWHRELVKRKWTFRRTGRTGRPPLDPGLIELVLRLGRRTGDGDASGSRGSSPSSASESPPPRSARCSAPTASGPPPAARAPHGRSS
jgi:putative transposase